VPPSRGFFVQGSKHSKKEGKKRKKDEKAHKKQKKKEKKHKKKKKNERDVVESPPKWALKPPAGLTTISSDGKVVVAFGDGGSISYPPGFEGDFVLGRVELWANSGVLVEGEDQENGGRLGEDIGTVAEVPVAKLVEAGDAAGFFAQLLAQEQVQQNFICGCASIFPCVVQRFVQSGKLKLCRWR
jgi:hypothetical protein